MVSLAGCFLAVGAYDTGALTLSGAGLISGIGSMLSFAFLNIYTRHVLQRYNVWTMTFYAIAFASLFWLVINPPWNVIAQSPSSGAWNGLAVLAIISVLIPHTLYFAGMQYVVASRAIITSTLEPVIAMMSAALFLAELLQPLQSVGALLVIGAIVLLQLKKEEETIKGSMTARNANVA